MRVSRLVINNFRGIKSAELRFENHALLVGPNNAGKSTICEALDVVLGPDRLSRTPPVEEFDFDNAEYLTKSDPPEPIPIRIEVVLTDLTAEIENTCSAYLEFWHSAEKRLLGEGELKQPILRMSRHACASKQLRATIAKKTSSRHERITPIRPIRKTESYGESPEALSVYSASSTCVRCEPGHVH